MKRLTVLITFVLVLVIAVVTVRSSSFGQGQVVVTLDPNLQHQTIVGWEVTDGIGHYDFPSEFHRWRDEVNDRVVNEVGINRLRLESHQEKDRVEATNDNNDPLVIDWNGFDFSEFDVKVDNIVVPLRQHLAARGEELYLNFNTVSVGGRVDPGDGFHIEPQEFAEFVLAHFLHLESKYGFVPDGVELSLEPDVFNTFDRDPRKYGAALVATGDRLAAHGYHPEFIGPSNSTTGSALQWFDGLVQVPRVLEYLREFSYHRYGVGSGHIQQIAERAGQRNIGTSMLEHIGADYHELHEDLKVGNNVAWQQYTMAYPGSDNGARLYNISDVNRGTVEIGSRTKYLRQYFKYVRRGAVRVEASSSDGKFDPVGFINANGKYVVVVKASGGGDFSVGGLPAGVYGIKYTTGNQYDVDRADVTISSGQLLATNIPSAGVITVYGKQSAGADFRLCISQGPPSGTPTPCPPS